MEILKAQEVHYTYKSRYQTVRAVQGVSYSFEAGKFYAIVGKSGCGKTTFISMLAGLDLPTEGEVRYEGTDTGKLNRDHYRRDSVALICQSYNLFPLLTVQENVMYPMQLRKVPGRKAKEIAAKKLKDVGLDEQYFRRLPAMLSGGEQQRVAIARALASDAKIILADEPTGNLDTENGENIIAILRRLAKEQGYCVIVVTHDLAIAQKADEVLRMKDGKIESDPAGAAQ